MKVLLINNGSQHTEYLLKMLKDFSLTEISMKEIPDDVSQYDFIVLSGGSLEPAFYESKTYQKVIKFIHDSDKPIFGTCLGMQLISQAFYPNKLIQLFPKRRGVIEIDVDQKTFGVNKLKVSKAHRWAVGKIDKPLVILGRSKDGIEIIKHEEKLIWGVQFHPQLDLEHDTEGQRIFDYFISQI